MLVNFVSYFIGIGFYVVWCNMLNQFKIFVFDDYFGYWVLIDEVNVWVLLDISEELVCGLMLEGLI